MDTATHVCCQSLDALSERCVNSLHSGNLRILAEHKPLVARRVCRHVATFGLFALASLPIFSVGRRYMQAGKDQALIAAVKRSDTDETVSLLAAGANPNTREVPARCHSLGELLRALLHPRPQDLLCQTALMKAAGSASPSIVSALIASGADVNAMDKYGDTALMNASYNGDSVDELAYTHEINLNDERGDTPSILAAHKRDAQIVKTLIAAGADVNAKDGKGYTALMLSTDCDNYDCAKALIASGADVNAVDKRYSSALSWAESGGHTIVASILIKAGAKQK